LGKDKSAVGAVGGEVGGELEKALLVFQKNEITEHMVYSRLAERVAKKRAGGVGEKNAATLQKIASEEKKHYETLREITGLEVAPSKVKVFLYSFMALIFGITFAIKLMERGEKKAEEAYRKTSISLPAVEALLEDETRHEQLLVDMIDERRVEYVGSMVLGLNDALVEITGALAGLSFALQNTRLVGVAGLITGLAASMSMASSDYLARKSEGHENPLTSAFYTGMAYVVVVLLLVTPFFLFNVYIIALPLTLTVGVVVVLVFTFYVSVVKERNFRRLALEMVSISLGIALISFLIGYVVRLFLGVDV